MSTYRIYYYCFIYIIIFFFFGFLRVPTVSVGKFVYLRIVNDKNPRVERPVFTTARAVCNMNIWWADGGAVDLQYSQAAGCSGWAPHRLARCTSRIFSVGLEDRCNCGPAATARDVPPTLGHHVGKQFSACRRSGVSRLPAHESWRRRNRIRRYNIYFSHIYFRCRDKSVEIIIIIIIKKKPIVSIVIV